MFCKHKTTYYIPRFENSIKFLNLAKQLKFGKQYALNFMWLHYLGTKFIRILHEAKSSILSSSSWSSEHPNLPTRYPSCVHPHAPPGGLHCHLTACLHPRPRGVPLGAHAALPPHYSQARPVSLLSQKALLG